MLLTSLFKQWSFRILAPGAIMRKRYESMKRLLHADIQCHEQMAAIQELLHGDEREDFSAIRRRIDEFSANVLIMITELDEMVSGRYRSLREYHKKFDFYTKFLLAPPTSRTSPPYISVLEELSEDSKGFGSKTTNLALLHEKLSLPIPRGFGVSASAFFLFVEGNCLRTEIDSLLQNIDITSHSSLHQISEQITEQILQAKIPAEIEETLFAGYDNLDKQGKGYLKVAVRSSALYEDDQYSFAGQYDTQLQVMRKDLAESYRKVIASKYSPQSLYYRISHGVMDEEAAMTVLVQEMVEADWSGILYTRPFRVDGDNRDSLYLHITGGLGNTLANGEVTPEKLEIHRANISEQTIAELNTTPLPLHIILELLEKGLEIEKFFSAPQDIEWAFSVDDGLFFLQARELEQIEIVQEITFNPDNHVCLAEGESGSTGLGTGPVFVHDGTRDFEDLAAGSVLVTRNTPAEYTKILHKLNGLISERGSHASHLATVAREFGVPFVTGVQRILKLFDDGDLVTVDGNSGKIYEGTFDSPKKSKRGFPQTRYHEVLGEALSFISPLELMDPAAENFNPEGCRSMHDIIRFCHENCLLSMFSGPKPGSGRGAVKLQTDIKLDVYLFDVGGGLSEREKKMKQPQLEDICSTPFLALWKGLSHPGVQWKQKPFDWEAQEKIALTGAVAPKSDSFAFASYAVVGTDYLHFHIRFGYHFTIVDVLCSDVKEENHCMLRFAGGGGNYENKSMRILFLSIIMNDIGFEVNNKGDLLEARLQNINAELLLEKLDYLGRLLGSSKLMDMVLEDEEMVAKCVTDFHNGVYSFSEEG